jgi:hypothetical protein
MRTPLLTALLLVVAIATTAGCGGNDKKTDKANASTTSAQSSTTTSTTDTTATTTAPSTSDADGGTSDAAPGRVVVEYFNALSKRDSKGACTYMGGEMQRAAINFVKSALKATTVSNCADAIAKIISPQTAAALAKARNLQILKSTVHGNSATVKVKGAVRNALLTKRDGRWLITGGIFTTP